MPLEKNSPPPEDTSTVTPEENSSEQQQRGPGKKFDQGKPNYSLIPMEALDEVAKVFTFGATKYGDHNWRGGFNWTRLSSAVLRHISAWLRGETYDPESRCHHLAHAICGLLMLLSFAFTKSGKDDRYKPPKE